MESNAYEHELFQAVQMLSIIANRAYWKGETDCGSDFSSERCVECKHLIVCTANDKLKRAVDKLKSWESQGEKKDYTLSSDH